MWIIALTAGALQYGLARADTVDHRSEMQNVVYRDTAGKLTEDSKYFAKRLIKKARQQGSVLLWVTLNIPYQTNMAEMTPDEIASQEAIVQQKLSELLDPLVRRGFVSHPGGAPVIAGNGCRVIATATGVRALVSDSRVLHIVEKIN